MLISLDVQPEVVELVRFARGLTQAELATKSRLSQGFLSKVEKGVQEVDAERLLRIAEALDCPVELLTTPIGMPGSPDSPCDFFRKRASTPVSVVKQTRGVLGVAQLAVRRLIPIEVDHLPHLSPSEDGFIGSAEIAQRVRAAAGLPAGPVADVVGVFESMGVVVLTSPLPTPEVDAISHRPVGGLPLMILNAGAPGDRLRHSASHEGGHLVMHERPVENQEQDADAFAAEFLMPAATIRRELSNLSLERLADLKQKWRVSMAALLRRAHSLGEISERQYRSLNIELSKAGYRTREPITIPAEQPQLLLRYVKSMLTAGRTMEEIATIALIKPSRLTEMIGGSDALVG